MPKSSSPIQQQASEAWLRRAYEELVAQQSAINHRPQIIPNPRPYSAGPPLLDTSKMLFERAFRRLQEERAVGIVSDEDDAYGMRYAGELLCPPGVRVLSVWKDPEDMSWKGQFLIERTNRTVVIDVTEVSQKVAEIRVKLMMLA